jgi:hypothetical protein
MALNDNYLWGALLLGIIIFCCLTPYADGSLRRRETFTAPFIPSQPWVEYPDHGSNKLYLGGSTKCFSCEKDMISRGGPTYLAQPTKCVDCDAQAVHSYGSEAGHFGQNNKCFSCESQYANNPFKTRATPYCNSNKCDANNVSRFGRADGQSMPDQIDNSGVGLVSGFGRADGMAAHEGDTQNPTGYQLGY